MRVARCRERGASCERGLLLVLLGRQSTAKARLLLQLTVSSSVHSCGAQALPELTSAHAEAAGADADPI